jgi:hypothetical protein
VQIPFQVNGLSFLKVHELTGSQVTVYINNRSFVICICLNMVPCWIFSVRTGMGACSLFNILCSLFDIPCSLFVILTFLT